jgi:hypothetical protein
VHSLRSTAALPAALGALFVLASGPAAAQELAPSMSAQLHAGIAVPAGGMADITSAGPSLGLGGLFRFLPNWGARLDFTMDMLDGNQDSLGNLFPSMKLLHLTGGIQADLPRPKWQDLPLTTTLNAGIGFTHMDANQNDVAGPVGAFSKTYFTATAGIQLGWQFSDRLNLYAEGQSYLTFGKRGSLDVFAAHSPEVGRFRNVWSFPLSVGARITFPTTEQ